jgi:5S rRNA maturation endonuclease (ribonuclease M5)
MAKDSEEIRQLLSEICSLVEKEKNSLIVVEGKRDRAALQQLGFSNIIILNKPLYEVIEDIESKGEKRMLLLTDLDKEGKRIYAKLKNDLDKRGVVVDDALRNLLFKTELRQVEGLTSYLKKFE